MNANLPIPPEKTEVLLYQTKGGQTKLEVAFRGETCWLSLNQLVELFQRDKSVISRHISNIFSEGELVRDSVVAKFATTAGELLTHAGTISHEEALAKAQIEYEKYHALQVNRPSPIEAHFEQAIKTLPKPKPGRKGKK